MATQMNEKPTDSPDFDPTVNEPVPPHIARMAAEAEARGRKALEGDEGNTGGEEPPAADAGDQPPSPGDGEPKGDEPSPQGGDPPKGDVEPPPKQEGDLEALKHKLSVLQGKYDAEVPRLHAELQRAGQIIERQQQMIDQLGQQGTAQVEPEKKIEPLKVDDYEAFGPEVQRLVEAVNLIAAKEGSDLSEPLKALTDQQRDLAQRQEKFEFERFQERVYQTAAAKTGRSLQEIIAVDTSDEGFRNWLQEVEPYTGATKHQLLVDAANRRDLDRAVAFYVSYLGTKKPAEPKKPEQGLEGQVIPGTGKAPAGKPKGGASEIEALRRKFQQATSDFRAGRISEQEHNAITAEYQQAIAKARR